MPFIQAKKEVVPPQPQAEPIQQKENENSETTEQLIQGVPLSFDSGITQNNNTSQLKSLSPSPILPNNRANTSNAPLANPLQMQGNFQVFQPQEVAENQNGNLIPAPTDQFSQNNNQQQPTNNQEQNTNILAPQNANQSVLPPQNTENAANGNVVVPQNGENQTNITNNATSVTPQNNNANVTTNDNTAENQNQQEVTSNLPQPTAETAISDVDAVKENDAAEQSGEVEIQQSDEAQSLQKISPLKPDGVSNQITNSSGAGGGGGASGPTAPTSPEADPDFQATKEQVKGDSETQKTHPTAENESQESQDAAVSPPSELESQAQDGQVDEMSQQEAGTFDAASFKAMLMEKIEAVAPRTLEEADNFKSNNKLDQVKSQVSEQVQTGKKQAGEAIEESTEKEPDTTAVEPKEVTPLPPPEDTPKPNKIDGIKAAPKPKTESETSLQEGSDNLDRQMDEANVTEEQLASSNEPTFNTALKEKKTAQKDAKTAPVKYKKQEKTILNKAKQQSEGEADTQFGEMLGEKDGILSQVIGEQQQTKGEDEQKRAEIATHIQSIYTTTKQEVETLLNNLDGKVNTLFEQAATQAYQVFTAHVDARMKAYKDERYDGWLTGSAKWLKDKLMGMPDEVNVFYEEGRQMYMEAMDNSFTQIAEVISNDLNAAKMAIANGRQQIKEYVQSLPNELQEIGQQAATDISAKFDELEQNIDAKQNELINSLAQKYQENLDQVDAKIDEMKAANGGLVAKAFDAVAGVIQTILELKNMLMGVLQRAASAIEAIIKDPIGFLSNLINGLKMGFTNFMNNIGAHLKKGIIGWLFGALAGAGLQLPEKFDLKGILSIILQTLGLTYDNVRGKAVKMFGEETVERLEKTAEIFKIMMTEGVAGIWNFIKDKLTSVKETVMSAVTRMVGEEIVKAGITWILSMLNPASAFIKACKAIYDVVMFFVNRASQIMSLINAVMEAIVSVASGSANAAATAIENALSRALPVAISFLASLLGLGNISEKIKGILKRIQAPINKAIEWVLNLAKKAIGAVKGFLGGGKGKKKGKNAKEEKPKGEFDGEIGEVMSFSADNESHKLYVGKQGEAIVESTPMPVSAKLDSWKKDANEEQKKLIASAKSTNINLLEKVEEVKQAPEDKKEELDIEVEALQRSLKEQLRTLFSQLGEGKKEHKEFKPENIEKEPVGISTKITYNTVAGKNFEVMLDSNDMITSIKGFSLSLKENSGIEGRGYTGQAGRKTTNMGMNSSHLIADQFGGSGYKASSNLIATSEHYNQTEMSRIEEQIKDFIRSNNANEFDLQVDVEWGKINNNAARQAIFLRLINEYDIGQEELNNIKSEVSQKLENANPNLKRCMGVTYKVTIKSGKETLNRTFPLGPDTWLGISN
ncbi:MAG: DNA/RNA non-specific endonuclease [Chitinophagales bacterium]